MALRWVLGLEIPRVPADWICGRPSDDRPRGAPGVRSPPWLEVVDGRVDPDVLRVPEEAGCLEPVVGLRTGA